MQGVTKETNRVLEKIKEYPELKGYYLVGGTALSIHLNHRLSEDLDLFYYGQFPGKKFSLPKIDLIINKLSKDFKYHTIQGDNQYVSMIIDDIVKLDFYADNNFHKAKECTEIGNIRLPSPKDLIGMKLTSMVIRDAWRDIFDLYALSQEYKEEDFKESFKSIMSSYYAGSKTNRLKLYNTQLKKLQDLDFVENLKKTDPMKGLILTLEASPLEVVSAFKKFIMLQIN